MKPPQGRIQIGWRVRDLAGRSGTVVGERPITSNGAWYYAVVFDDGKCEELPDFELHRLQSEPVSREAATDTGRSGKHTG